MSLLDWKTGEPNARYRVLQLLHDSFGPGDRIAETKQPLSDVFAQAYVGPAGQRKLLLINKRDHDVSVGVPRAAGKPGKYVDLTTASRPPISFAAPSGDLTVHAFSVMVLQM